MRKQFFSMLQCFIHLKLKFCCWGLLPQTPTGAVSLDPAWGLPSPWLPETWTPSHKNPAMPLMNTYDLRTASVPVCPKSLSSVI